MNHTGEQREGSKLPIKLGDPTLKGGQTHRAWAPYFVLAVALLLTVLATYYVARTAEAKDQLKFQNAIEDIHDSIHDRLETYIALLRSGSALFSAGGQVSADQFHAFVDRLNLRSNYPGSQGIGFSVRVKPEERDALVASMRRRGVENFRIWPEGERPEYYSIVYLEPLDRRNRVAIGYDMFTEPERRGAMERARDTGHRAASGRVTLVQEIDEQKQAGFLIYVPVYRNGKVPDTVAERQASLEGFIYSPFRANDLLDEILSRQSRKSVDLQIFDGTELTPDHLLYRSNQSRGAADSSSYRPRFTATTTMDVAGRTWSLSFATRPEFDAVASGKGLAPPILLGGTLVSLVLFGVTLAQTRARQVAERSALELRQSEEAIRFQAHLLDTVEQSVIATDLNGTIIYWNKFAEALYGWPAAEATGRNIMEVTPAEATLGQATEIMSRLKAGKSWSGEILLRRRDGSTFPALVTDSPIYDDKGSLIGIIGVSTNISERKRAEEALREADQRALTEYERLLDRITGLGQALGTARDLATIFRALRDFAAASVPCAGIFISLYDPGRQVRTASYGWGDGVEFDVSGLPPMPVTTEGPNSRAVRTGQIIITDDYMSATKANPGVVVGPDNGLRPQSSLAAPMAVMGRIVGTIEVQSYERAAYKDEHVTAMRMAANLAAVAIENVQLFERESRARAAAEESNRMKDEFLATVSHELRTPLTAILGWSRMLTSGTLDGATSARAIQIIERNAKVQTQIIEDILDVSRIITGKLHLEFQPVELISVIEAAMNAVRPAVEAKGIQLEAVLDSGANVVFGDADRLQQVIWNLLSNAVKFTPGGGRIQVHLRNTGSSTELKVIDTGQGISREFLPYVFDRFRQADSMTARQHGGLGLGLAIVRHLVELHGGTVHAESPGEGQGATFTPRLPLAGKVMREGAVAEDVKALAEENVPVNHQTALGGLHVLVVDDEPDTLTMLTTILEERRVKVTTASSAGEAIKAIERSTPDILVSDIGMPDADGYELIRAVRRLESKRGGAIPAVALTAYAREEDRMRSLSAGYQIHLAKPVEPSELIAVLAELAGQHPNKPGGMGARVKGDSRSLRDDQNTRAGD